VRELGGRKDAGSHVRTTDNFKIEFPNRVGSGLAIVKHLIGLHGGQAVAENRPEGARGS